MAALNAHERTAVLRGAAVQLAVALPVVFVVRAATQDEADGSNVQLLAVVVALVLAPAFAAAVVVAGRTARPVPHAVVATALAWAVAAVVTIVRSAASDGGSGLLEVVIRLPFILLVQAGVAAAAASLAIVLRRTPAP